MGHVDNTLNRPIILAKAMFKDPEILRVNVNDLLLIEDPKQGPEYIHAFGVEFTQIQRPLVHNNDSFALRSYHTAL